MAPISRTYAVGHLLIVFACDSVEETLFCHIFAYNENVAKNRKRTALPRSKSMG